MAADDRRSSQGELATNLQNLSRLLADSGRGEEALDAAEDAVVLFRALAAEAPSYRSELASGLQNLSLALAALGRSEQAMEVSDEAIELYQALAATDPALYSSELANSMSNRLGILDAAGRDSDALEEALEAVSNLRNSADLNPERYSADLAGALNNLSRRLASSGDGDALQIAEEAVAGLRQVAKQKPERFAGDLAAGLSNLSLRLTETGRDEEALEAHEEALDILRAEADRYPDLAASDLAGALSNQAILLDNANRIEEAVAAAEEALERWQAIVAMTDSARPDLAVALNNLSIVLDKDDRAAEAADAALKATSLFRALANEDPERFRPPLALSLSNLSRSLTSAGRYDQAVLALEEAIQLRREMTEAKAGDEYAVELAGSLNDLSSLLSALGHENDAIASGQEALERYRDLAAADPQRFVPDLARTLSNVAITLEGLGRHGEAENLIETTLSDFDDMRLRGVLELARGVWLMNSEDIRGAADSGWRALRALERLQSTGHAAQARNFLRSLCELDATAVASAWREATGNEPPAWLRYPNEDPELRELLIEWLMTETWESSRKFLTEHRGSLLSDRAEAQLQRIVDQQPGQPELARHLGMLVEARRHGIGAAFSQVLDAVGGRRRREQLNAWLWLEPDESLLFLREHGDELLDPRTADELVDEALSQPDEPSLWARVGLLNRCRVEGIESGSTLFERELRGEPIPTWTPETPDRERALDLARLGAGLNRRSAEHQFLHALAAAETKHSREADQAIFRCRSLLASWDVPDYTRRLNDLIATSKRSRGDWEHLRRSLSGLPADFRS